MAGFVYIFSNPTHDMIKIGKTTKDPLKYLLKQLNSESGTPEKFKCEYYAFVKDEDRLEWSLHENFSDQRPNDRREFFKITAIEAIYTIREMAWKFGGLKYEENYCQDFIEQEYENGDVYEGEFKNDKWHGQGVLILADEGQYVGGFKADRWHGHGTYTHSGGHRYVGEFKNSKFNGHGTKTLPDGTKYAGGCRAGKYHGHGSLKFDYRTGYVGEFKNDKYHGHGILKLGWDTEYVGNFKAGKYDGHGTLKSDSTKYVGEFKANKYHGQGTLKEPDNIEYIGNFKAGKQHGQFTGITNASTGLLRTKV